ncbi:MAG: dihydroorotate dehydrogenase electron transfer subunit [Spirochaetia bacterium]|jgi:dihydroorotate dehydrogenase electron transfer subunit|nr:dihydroorotate dehydrogenase electron transfer subunit [Spirochaetia bacterium]
MPERITCRIKRIVDEGPSARSLYFESDMRVLPGQFLMVTDYGEGERPFSVADSDGSRIVLTIKKMGPFSRRICSKKEGDLLSLRGPFGNPFTPRAGTALLVGGGAGIAPLYLLARELASAGGRVIVVNGARVADDLILGAWFGRLNVDYVETSEDRGERLTSVQLAGRVMEREKVSVVYAAGPELMMAALKNILRDIPYEFSFERYMKCGVGICGSCACDPTGIRVCVEGPVFGREQIEKLSDFGVYKRDATGARVYFKK